MPLSLHQTALHHYFLCYFVADLLFCNRLFFGFTLKSECFGNDFGQGFAVILSCKVEVDAEFLVYRYLVGLYKLDQCAVRVLNVGEMAVGTAHTEIDRYRTQRDVLPLAIFGMASCCARQNRDGYIRGRPETVLIEFDGSTVE